MPRLARGRSAALSLVLGAPTLAASANPRTIVVLNTGSAVTMPWLKVGYRWYDSQNIEPLLSFGFSNIRTSEVAVNGEPPEQLRGYQKVSLDPGESRIPQFQLTCRDLAHWNDSTATWTTTAGAYQVVVGDSPSPPRACPPGFRSPPSRPWTPAGSRAALHLSGPLPESLSRSPLRLTPRKY
jgi:hypothetical protein